MQLDILVHIFTLQIVLTSNERAKPRWVTTVMGYCMVTRQPVLRVRVSLRVDNVQPGPLPQRTLPVTRDNHYLPFHKFLAFYCIWVYNCNWKIAKIQEIAKSKEIVKIQETAKWQGNSKKARK